MATLSVRQIAKNCFGVTGDFSINTHVYGYVFRDTDGSLFGTLAASDTLPGSGAPTKRSLKRHLQTVSGKATDLVMILVSHENDFSGVVTRDQATKSQYAVQIARDIYAQRNLGIRTVRWLRIPVADAGGYANISDRGEAEDLTDDWSSSGGGIDAFLVQSIGDAKRLVERRRPVHQGIEDRSVRRGDRAVVGPPLPGSAARPRGRALPRARAREQHYESDGQQFRFITWRLLLPAMLVAVLFRYIFAFRIFSEAWLLTKGGPARSTEVLAVYLYKQAFSYHDFGLTSATGWMMVLLSFAIALYYLRLAYRRMFTADAAPAGATPAAAAA